MLDEFNNKFVTRDGYIHLSRLETMGLEYFINNKHKLLTQRQIASDLLHTGKIQNVRNIVFRLNKRLKNYVEIVSVRNVGYKIRYVGD